MQKIVTHSYVSNAIGPHFLIFGGIHGNEVCGQLALDRLHGELDSGLIRLKKGTLDFVPRCNPGASPHHRYLEKNLNNIFRTIANPTAYEETLIPELLPLIDACDVLLDIHSFPSPGKPFVFQDYMDDTSRAFAENCGLDFIVMDWFSLVREPDRAEPGNYAHDRGKISTTIECGKNDDPASIDMAYHAIRSSLAHLGMVDYDAPRTPVQRVSVKEIVMRPAQFSFTGAWKNFDFIQKGTAIAAHDRTGEPLRAPYDSYILLPYDKADIGTEWYFLARKYEDGLTPTRSDVLRNKVNGGLEHD